MNIYSDEFCSKCFGKTASCTIIPYHIQWNYVLFDIVVCHFFETHPILGQFWPIFHHFTSQNYQCLGSNRLEIKESNIIWHSLPNDEKIYKKAEEYGGLSIFVNFQFLKITKILKNGKNPPPTAPNTVCVYIKWLENLLVASNSHSRLKF